MSMKKPVFLLPSYASACTNYNICNSRSSTSCISKPSHDRRQYATHVDGRHDSSQEPLENVSAYYWPPAEFPRTVPTPYAILNIDPSAKYIKTTRFYELVKLYHPDRHDHPQASRISRIPKHIRLERYRLVVSAHAILSDPLKRREYDLYGAGWAGAKSALDRMPDFNMSPEARDAVMHNATWQDWENWYDRFNPPKPGDPPRQPQRPLFLSNTAFFGLVGVLAALAGVGQATRAHEGGNKFRALVDQYSERAKGELSAVERSKQGMTKAERIDHFVRERDPEMFADEDIRKLTINPDVCASADDEGPETLRRKYGNG